MATKMLEPAERRAETLALAEAHINPARMAMLNAFGVDFVGARAEGYKVWDLNGREFLDFDLRAGVYNLGHRHPDIVSALTDALQTADMGFALYPGEAQTALAKKLASSSGTDYVIFTPSGTEANDMAIRCARRHTGKRRIISCDQGYHGASGLACAAGDPEFAAKYNSDYASEFTTVPVNDAEAIESELAKGDVAGVLLEPICNAAGYPAPPENYWSTVRALCDQYDVVLIADEIVTGLGRSGMVWGHQKHGIQPDIVVCGKGLSGGIYPISATMVAKRVAKWIPENDVSYAGTFAGGELACHVGARAFDLSVSDKTLSHGQNIADTFRAGLDDIASRNAVVREVRQFGLLFGLELDREGANWSTTLALFQNGVLAFPPVHADTVINLKPGHLVEESICTDALQRIEDVIGSL